MGNLKQYFPLIAIGAVVLYALSRMKTPATQVINRAVGFTGNQVTPVNRDAAQVSAFSQLASLAGIESNAASRERVSNLQAQIASQTQANTLAIETLRSNNALEAERIRANSRSYDYAQQQAAIDRISQREAEAFERAQRNNLLGGILSAIGQALGRAGQQSRSGGSSGGASGGQTTQRPPQRQTAANRRGALDRVNQYLNSIFSASPASYSDFGFYGSEFLNMPDFWGYPDPADYWPYWDEPEGVVTSSYSYGFVDDPGFWDAVLPPDFFWE